MTTQTKTMLATILRQVAQGIYTKEEAYSLISELYLRQLNKGSY